MALIPYGKFSARLDATADVDPQKVASWVNGGIAPANVTKTLYHGLGLSTADQLQLEVLFEGIVEAPLSGVDWILNVADPANAVDVTFYDAVPGTATARVLVRMKHSVIR
jgi:hypothetical protein